MVLTSGALASSGRGSVLHRTRFSAVALFHALTIVALGLLAQGLFASSSRAQQRVFVVGEADSLDVVTIEAQGEFETSSRDSLMLEIRRYSRMIANMRDSLSTGGMEFELSDEQRQALEENIADVSQVIEKIGAELSQLEFEIRDNTISLVNESGEGIIINIPENLDEHLSEGLEVLSQVILSELPDSIDFDSSHSWDWTSFAPHTPPPPRKIVHGNVIKVWDDLYLPAHEDVRGDVVVVFGNAEIAGRVDGNVVAVFGNLLLDETAEVTEKVVSVGGRLDQNPDADLGEIVAIDLMPGDGDDGLLGYLGQGILPFLMCQGTFLLTLILAVIVVVAVPGPRFQTMVDTLRHSFGPSLGVGLVAAIVGQVVIAVLMAVLILTVIGVPLALLVFLGQVIVLIGSVAVCGTALGQVCCRMMGSGCTRPWLTVIVGMTLLHAVSFLGSVVSVSGNPGGVADALVVIGMLIKTVAALLGLGALILSRFGTKPPTVSGPEGEFSPADGGNPSF